MAIYYYIFFSQPWLSSWLVGLNLQLTGLVLCSQFFSRRSRSECVLGATVCRVTANMLTSAIPDSTGQPQHRWFWQAISDCHLSASWLAVHPVTQQQHLALKPNQEIGHKQQHLTCSVATSRTHVAPLLPDYWYDSSLWGEQLAKQTCLTYNATHNQTEHTDIWSQ